MAIYSFPELSLRQRGFSCAARTRSGARRGVFSQRSGMGDAPLPQCIYFLERQRECAQGRSHIVRRDGEVYRMNSVVPLQPYVIEQRNQVTLRPAHHVVGNETLPLSSHVSINDDLFHVFQELIQAAKIHSSS